MEQPNMMPPNGMPQQNMSSMHRPQPGNPSQQIFAKILHDLQQTVHQIGNDWQSTFDIKQRASKIMQLMTQLRLLTQDVGHCIRTAMSFELKTIQNAPSREAYEGEMKRKMEEIMAKRVQQASMQMPNGVQMNANMAMPNNGMANMNMQNGGMGMPNVQMNGNAGGQQNTGFPAHLQRQMQPSTLPLAQQPNSKDPSALQSNPMLPQASDISQAQPQQPPSANPGAGGPAQFSGREAQALAVSMYNQMPDEQKNQVRARWLGSLTEQQRARITSSPGDPLLTVLLVNRARQQIVKTSQQGQGQQQNGGGMQMGNQQMGGNTSQPPVSQAGAPGIDFSSILGQQASALKQQESGEQVVPASNNVNFNLGAAGMNMPQGINPQMLANQQGTNPQLASQMQQLMVQQQKQQMMQRHVLAQRQAMQQQQQANQLRGQPGGLNAPNALNGGPAAQINSPAMSMLNRPMVPPGQATPGTPQPNRPPGQPPQTPQNAAAMHLMQHHQHMIGQNNQGAIQASQGPVQPQTNQPEMVQLLQALPPSMRQKVMEQNISPDQLRNFVTKFRQSQMGQVNGIAMNTQQGQQGVPNMGMNMNVPQISQAMMNGIPVQSMQGNATPMFNSQPPPNQPPPAVSMDPMQLQQKYQQHQHTQLKQKAMDSRPFPRHILSQIGVSVPAEVQSWGRLKNHLMQIQSVLPPQLMDRVRAMQAQWFDTHPDEMNSALQALRQHVQQNAQQQQSQRQPGGQPQPQQPPVSGPPGMPMQNGQAPPAQMVPPAAPMQQSQPPNQGLGPQGMNQRQLSNPPPTTVQEVQAFRQQIPQAVNYTDEQVRDLLIKNKKRRQQGQQIQQQESLRNAQMQRAQAAAGQQGGGMPNGAQGPRQPQPQQVPPGQQQPIPAQAQGQKRSQPPASVAGSDDVMEIPNPNALPPAQMGAPQALLMQSSKSQQQAPQQGSHSNIQGPTQEQLQQMPPEKRAQILQLLTQRSKEQNEALRKAQMGIPNNQQAQPSVQQPQHQQQPGQANATGVVQGREAQVQGIQKLTAMYKEVERENPKGPAVDIDAAGLQQAQVMLNRLWGLTTKIQSTYFAALNVPSFEQKLRQVMRARIQITQNAMDSTGAIKDYLSLSIQQMRDLEILVYQYIGEIKAMKDKMDAQRGQQQAGQQQGLQNGQRVLAQSQAQIQAQQRPPSASVKPQSSSQQAPPTPSERGQPRKASSNSKAPPAPTENKVFDWGTLSPHGVPKYDQARNELTPDKLKFPPNKKRKPNQPDSAASTPAAQTGTPGAFIASPNVVAKAPSPEATKKLQHHVKLEMGEREREEQKKWKCNDILCDVSINGLETEDELKKHVDAEHAPVEDPLAFFCENAAGALGFDLAGNVLPVEKATGVLDVKAQPRPTPVPGTRVGTKQKPATPPASGPASKSKGKAVATSAPSVDAPAKEKTLRETHEEKMGYKQSTETDDQDTTMPDAQISEEDSWRDMLQETLGGTAGVGDWPSFSQNENIDWGLPQYPDSSPELTPDGGSSSSRASDISQSERLRLNMEWDPFGNGDCHVPDALKMQTLGLSGTPEQASGGDANELPSAAGKEGGKDDDWDWSRDEEARDWETLFGANAGLDVAGWDSNHAFGD